jgi:hypothetical protein
MFEAVAYSLLNKPEGCALFLGPMKMAYNETPANHHIYVLW